MSGFNQFRAAVNGLAPRAAVVFGSGLAGAAEKHFVPATEIPYAEVPGLVPPTVAGHRGKLAVGHWAGVSTVLCFGRVHFYEGHSWERVVALVRLIAEFGVKDLLLTNAAGGIRDDLHPGDLMPIGGHLKWLGSQAWRSDFTEARHGWHHLPSLGTATGRQPGTYAALTGPCYETPAEIRALRVSGADAVGMSTAVEAECATELGLRVAGISCITNKAAGLSANTLNHHEVEAVARTAVGKLGQVIDQLLQSLASRSC